MRVPRARCHSIVLSRLDYGNAVLVGLPLTSLPVWAYNRLQSVLNVNAAARSIAGLRRSDHITDAPGAFLAAAV